MMLQPVVAIPNPCYQSWTIMEPTEAGRFCSNCRTEVIDFTRMSQGEILNYLSQPQDKGVCGRLREARLKPHPRLLNWRQAAPRTAIALAAVLALTYCSSDSKVSVETPLTKVTPGYVRVAGKVVDKESNTPIAQAWIVCEADTLQHTRTAADGSFILMLPQQLAQSKLIAVALPPTDEELDKGLGMYVPRYFDAQANARIALRRLSPTRLGMLELLPGETMNKVTAQYVGPYGPPPPPPDLTTIKFTPPSKHKGH